MSIKLGYSLKILCPPVTECILCERNLSINKKLTQVAVFKLTGPEIYTKYLYRSKSCKLVKKSRSKVSERQDIYYHINQFGNLKTRWLFYKKCQNTYFRANNEVYFENMLIKSYINNLCHAWMSMEGQSEAYNQTWLNSEKLKNLSNISTTKPKSWESL